MVKYYIKQVTECDKIQVFNIMLGGELPQLYKDVESYKQQIVESVDKLNAFRKNKNKIKINTFELRAGVFVNGKLDSTYGTLLIKKLI